jgi:hypothetical protein
MRHALALALSLAAAAPLLAQDWKGMGRLEGRVLDPDGKPVEGASVTLDLPERGGGGPTAKSDKKGRWAVGGIVAGKWNADINAPGYVLKKITIPLAASPRACLRSTYAWSGHSPRAPRPSSWRR